MKFCHIRRSLGALLGKKLRWLVSMRLSLCVVLSILDLLAIHLLGDVVVGIIEGMRKDLIDFLLLFVDPYIPPQQNYTPFVLSNHASIFLPKQFS